MMRRFGVLVQRLALSLRVDGLGATLRQVWRHLFGAESRYVFVQLLKAPPTPLQLPVEMNGLVVRQMTARDREERRVARHEPPDMDRLALGVVATRHNQIVGAAWYTDTVTPAQPWYAATEPHVIRPALLDANLFVVPGEKAAGWAISKSATDALASTGVRSTVALVSVHNKRSILLLRLFGAKIVARLSVRRRFGYTTTVVEPTFADTDTAVRTPTNESTRARDQITP